MDFNNIFKILIKKWVGGGIPEVHIFKNGKSMDISKYIRILIFHPVKRRLAKHYLSALKILFGVKVIGITGSAGKTTTKEMLASILKLKGETIYSFANIDPVYNIPDTILKCRSSTKYLVLEMGVEYPGEMDYYLWLAKPDISIITNINPTHLEYFESVEGVYREKIKIVSKMDSSGTLIVNNNDEKLSNYINSNIHIIKFGEGGSIFASDIKRFRYKNSFILQVDSKKIKVDLPIYGSQFIDNALAASSAAIILGVGVENIKRGLEKFTLPEHRMNIFKEKHGTIIVDDTYNNNPAAAKESLISLKELSKGLNTGIVFGDMLELGKHSEKYHKEIGNIISHMKVDLLIGVGRYSKILIKEARKKNPRLKSFSVNNCNSVYEILKIFLGSNKIVLLKGSRSIGLDRVVAKLSNRK